MLIASSKLTLFYLILRIIDHRLYVKLSKLSNFYHRLSMIKTDPVFEIKMLNSVNFW